MNDRSTKRGGRDRRPHLWHGRIPARWVHREADALFAPAAARFHGAHVQGMFALAQRTARQGTGPRAILKRLEGRPRAVVNPPFHGRNRLGRPYAHAHLIVSGDDVRRPRRQEPLAGMRDKNHPGPLSSTER